LDWKFKKREVIKMKDKTTKASLTNGGHGKPVTSWCNPYRGSPVQTSSKAGEANT